MILISPREREQVRIGDFTNARSTIHQGPAGAIGPGVLHPRVEDRYVGRGDRLWRAI